MYDKELIERVCNLTCTKNDVVRNQTTIHYDIEYPFKKYYSIDALIGAFKKYLSKEWDDILLSHWACIYCWILSGGFSIELKEDLNSFEEFFMETLTWSLDGLSFFQDDLLEEGTKEVFDWIEFYKNLDDVWQTRNDWHCVYAMPEEYNKLNEDYYIVLINDKTKKYMIMYSNWLQIGFEDEHFKYVSKKDFKILIEELKNKNYEIIGCELTLS